MLSGGPTDASYSLRRDGQFLARAYVQWVPEKAAAGRFWVILALPATVPTSRMTPCVPNGD
jgi:hypothetical protein